VRRLAAGPRKGREWTNSSKTVGPRDARRRREKTGLLLLLALSLAAVQTCRIGGPGPLTPVFVTGDSVTLAWDPPSPAPGSDVTAWRIYSRVHGTAGWTEVDEIPADEGTRYTITRGELGEGDFDLAVSAVDTLGRESAPHSSTDTDAWPVGGWYLRWRPAP
jgi:hypothetical protein